jgi:hypothetical protein
MRFPSRNFCHGKKRSGVTLSRYWILDDPVGAVGSVVEVGLSLTKKFTKDRNMTEARSWACIRFTIVPASFVIVHREYFASLGPFKGLEEQQVIG